MKRFLLGLMLALGIASGASAVPATWWVDGGCTFDGDGTATDETTACATGAGLAGPWNKLSSVVWASVAAGDTVNIRGAAHAAHGANHVSAANFDGRYFTNGVTIQQAYGSDVTIQPFTGERVYIEGAKCPPGGSYSNDATDTTSCGTNVWHRCSSETPSDCSSGKCAGISPSMCSKVWYTEDNGTLAVNGSPDPPDERNNLDDWYKQTEWAVRPHGEPTYSVETISDLTNNHSGYVSSRCSNELWRPCKVNGDCPGGTCTASAAPEVDHYACNGIKFNQADHSYATNNCNGVNRLFVAWDTETPGTSANPRPYINYRYPSTFLLTSGSTPTTHVVLKNLDIRNYDRTPWVVSATDDSLKLDTVKINFVHGYAPHSTGANGGSRCTEIVSGGNHTTVTNSELGFCGDEGMHAWSRMGNLATVLTMTNNWIHWTGGASLMGPANGTPSGITIGDDHETNPNWTGSAIDGNLILDGEKQPFGSPAYGIRFEGGTNMTVKNNIIRSTGAQGTCIILGAPASGTIAATSTNTFYNNLLDGCGSYGINLDGAGCAIASNDFYHNTVNLTNTLAAIAGTGNISQQASNVFRNNILKCSSSKCVDWPSTSPTNLLEYNDIYSSPGFTINWRGNSYNCGNIANAGIGNFCASPQFLSATDFHLSASSPAVNAGVVTAIRTTDINNVAAVTHGLPDYSDGDTVTGPPDVGIDESVVPCAGFEDCSGQWTFSGTLADAAGCQIESPMMGFCSVTPTPVTSCTPGGTTCDSVVTPAGTAICGPAGQCQVTGGIQEGASVISDVCSANGLGSINHYFAGDYPAVYTAFWGTTIGTITRNGHSVMNLGEAPGATCAAQTTVAGLNTGCTYRVDGFIKGLTGNASNKLSVLVDAVEKCSWTSATTVGTWTALPACTFVPGAASVTLKLDPVRAGSPSPDVYLDDVSVSLVSCP